MRILLILFFNINILFSSLYQESFNYSQLNILKSFDINESFLTDRVLINMENNLIKNREDWYAQKFDNAHIFLPEVKKILREANISPLFIYMAMAESNFSITAYSNKRASGLWQFMPRTGKSFGLSIDRYVDERRDIIKSTKAAVKYLKYLHKMFGKWYLAAIAYNCGEGALRRAIKRAKSDSLSVLLDSKAKYIPRESRIYIRKIISLALVENRDNFLNSDKFEHIFNKGNSSAITSVMISGGIKLEDIAKELKVSFNDLKSINKHLKRNITPFNRLKYHIYIPYNKLVTFNNIKHKLEENRFIEHYVKSGETLSHIGNRYNVNYGLIKKFNNLKNSRLKIGQKLLIPAAFMQKKRNNKPKQNNLNGYIVKNGDTISEIAAKFNIKIKELKKLNNLKSNKIKIGDILKVKHKSRNYFVKKGETLETISKKFNIELSRLIKNNNLQNSHIKIGDKLVINN